MNTKIFTIFQGNYLKWKNDILKELQVRCKNVEFIIRDISFPSYTDPFFLIQKVRDRFKELLNEVRRMKKENEIDGMLIFGPYYDHEILATGLPIIMVSSILNFGEWKQGVEHFYRGGKVLHCTLCEHDVDQSIRSKRFDDLAQKIKLISVLKNIRNSKLLIISDGNPLMMCEQRLSSGSIDYEEKLLKELHETFGLKVVSISWEPLIEEINRVDEGEAEKIADVWINEAKDVKGTTRDEIIKAAKLYLAQKRLIEKYNCNMISMNSWGLRLGWGVLRGESKTNTMPPLAEMELTKEGIITSCEGLIECLLTQAMFYYISGRPSFIGDTLGMDPINNVVIFGHCYAPINPHGNDRVPYIIRDHYIYELHPEIVKTPDPAIKVEFPLNETVTVAKVSLVEKMIEVFTGETIDPKRLYRNFDNLMCRSKIAIKTNVEALLKNYDAETFGIHRVVVYGDYRQQIKDLATLVGYTVVEPDKP